MAKGKGKKGKKDDAVEPDHDSSWERAVSSQQWTLDPSRLPDAYTWPTWGALRERVLQACKRIQCENTPTVRDAFAAEIANLSPGELTHWSMQGCPNLHQVLLSPGNACPKLTTLNASHCAGLRYVLLQSLSLQTIDLSNCPELTKVIIYAPNALKIVFDNCIKLETVMIWGDALPSLQFPNCPSIKKLQQRCESLEKTEDLPECPPEVQARPVHPPIRDMVLETYRAARLQAAELKEERLKLDCNPSAAPAVFRCIGASRIGCL